MSSAKNKASGGEGAEVRDEGNVDTKVKNRILDARKRVDDREDYLYVQAPVEDGMAASQVQQDLYWGMVVKQYLRTIEPLLESKEVDEDSEYYRRADLGNVRLVPRNTDNYPFEQYATGSLSEEAFKTQHDLPRSVSLPEPKRIGFYGLKSVIETDGVVSETWTIETNSWSDPDQQGVIQTRDERVVPKKIYENAVRTADKFLQEVGIGVELELGSYTGGEGPGL